MATNQFKEDFLVSDQRENGVLRLTLNDPARRNALSEGMLDALCTTFDAIRFDKNVRVIILAAVGDGMLSIVCSQNKFKLSPSIISKSLFVLIEANCEALPPFGF